MYDVAMCFLCFGFDPGVVVRVTWLTGYISIIMETGCHSCQYIASTL